MSVHHSPASRHDAESYFALAEEGLIAPDDRTELLDGVIVAMAPQSPMHAAGVYRVEQALRAAFPPETVIRTQMSFVAGAASVPEPDLAVLCGQEDDYVTRHPSAALLVVEVAVTTVAQDRLTKARIYAGAGVKNYWIVQPEQEWVEAYTDVRAKQRVYGSCSRVGPGQSLTLDGAPEILVAASTLFPRRTLC